MLERLLPKERAYFDVFDDIADRANRAAGLLGELFAEPALLENRASAIKALEHEADEIVRNLNVRLGASFITPIDSEDIRDIAARLDDIVDRIDGTAWRALEFRISEVRLPALRLCEAIVRETDRIALMVKEIRRSSAVLADASVVRAIEEEGDAVYLAAVSELFVNPPEPLTVLKWKELYDQLEETIDACRHAAGILERVAVKHG
jgi:uncharacterized protein Yka (UPF0111/DUF47 family)